MNREEKARLLLMHRAAAAALEADLKLAVRREREDHGTAASWRTSAATIVANIAKDRVVVTDDQPFLAYLRQEWSEEIHEVLAPRSASWADARRKDLARFAERDPDTKKPTGRLVDAEGTVIPGVRFEPGGGYLSASITPDKKVTEVLLAAAAHGVATGEWGPLWAYSSDQDPGLVLAMLREHEESAERPASDAADGG